MIRASPQLPQVLGLPAFVLHRFVRALHDLRTKPKRIVAAAVGEVVSPLVASLVAAVTSAVEQIDLPQVCSSLWPEGHLDSAHPTTPRPQLTAVRIPTAFAPERWSHPGFPAARGHSTAAVSRTSPR